MVAPGHHPEGARITNSHQTMPDRHRGRRVSRAARLSSDRQKAIHFQALSVPVQAPRRFDQLTDPAAHALITGIRQQRGDEAALIAAELLARRRAEHVSTAGA